jgi:hypothetical protein
MLDMGFIPDIQRVLALVPAERQTLFFSATLPSKIRGLARDMVRNPVEIAIAPEQPTVERIAQTVLFMEKGSKVEALIALLSNQAIDKVLVFTRMKHGANKEVARLAVALDGAPFHASGNAPIAAVGLGTSAADDSDDDQQDRDKRAKHGRPLAACVFKRRNAANPSPILGQMAAALQSAGVPHALVELPDGDHGLNGYKGASWVRWQRESLEWIRSRLK